MDRQTAKSGWVRRVTGSLFWGTVLVGMLLVSLPAALVIFIYGLVSYWRSGRPRRLPADVGPEMTGQARRLTAFPTAAGLADRAVARALAAGDAGALAQPLGDGLRAALAALAETELPPVPDQQSHTSDEQHRARLAAHLAKISDAAYLADLEGLLARLAGNVLSALRPGDGAWSSAATWPAGTAERCLIDVLPDPPGAVAAIIDVLLQQSPPAQFLMMKSILAANIGIAGNVWPAAFTGSRQALIETYLQGTPFFAFFYLAIPRQRMAA